MASTAICISVMSYNRQWSLSRTTITFLHFMRFV